MSKKKPFDLKKAIKKMDKIQRKIENIDLQRQFLDSRVERVEERIEEKPPFFSFYKFRERVRFVVELLLLPTLISIIYHFFNNG